MFKAIGASVFGLLIAVPALAEQIGAVFYIALENHNLTQPPTVTSPQQLLGNPAAPFLNSLVTPGNPNAAMTSYAGDYQNVSPTTHPSEPNYVYHEAGVTGPLNDDDPYPNNIVSAPNLSGLLAAKGIAWRSYQEDADLLNASGQNFNSAGGALTSNVAPFSAYETPLKRFSGASSDYLNPYNGSHQYNFAPKHDGQLFFADTNGGDDPTPSNPQARNYAPLQQLSTDLSTDKVARYNWITPDQYNDMHSSLNSDFTYHGVTYLAKTDQEAVALGDNFLSIVVPEIEASKAFKNNGLIVIWTDETEGDAKASSTAGFTGAEIIISPLAKGDGYTNAIRYTHASDLRTLQNIFGVAGPTATGYLGGAAEATSLDDLFKPGAIPPSLPQTSTGR